MFLDKRFLITLGVSSLLVLGAGCTDDPVGGLDAGTGVDTGTGPDGGTIGPDGGTIGPDGGTIGGPLAESEKARVNFKRNRRLAADLAAALDLPRAEVCKELDRFDCFDIVHNVAIGGVEAYGQGIFEPLESTTKTTPIAVERIVLMGCRNRVDLDLADVSGATIFKNVTIDSDGKLDVASAEVGAAIDVLYKRFALRPATEDEIAHVRSLYTDIETSGDAEPARTWAILSCFAVGTTLESLFY